jgi:hypothetical protein
MVHIFTYQKSKFGYVFVWYVFAIWYILWPFGIFCGLLVYFVVIWYIFHHFGKLYQEKSGNPGVKSVPENETNVAEDYKKTHLFSFPLMQLDFPSAAILSKRKKINAPFLHFLKVALHSHMRQNMLE